MTEKQICTFRPAKLDELRVVYDMQNIPFRSEVFANHLPDFDVFERNTKAAIEEGREKLYIMERDNIMAGYGHFYMGAENDCDIIVWGRWLKTLMFAALKVAFDTLGVRAIHSAVRHDNKRVNSAYKHFEGRVIRREFMPFQKTGFLGPISMVGLLVYELTSEEFRAKEEQFRQQSMPVEILNPA
jgi:hypothetical protein